MLTAQQYATEDVNTLANQFAKLFISRPDVKAFQRPDGSWYPVRTKITREDLVRHLQGESSMGHYLCGLDNTVKFFAFDIDLEEAKPDKNIYYPMPIKLFDNPDEASDWGDNFVKGDPRGAWANPDKAHYTESFLIFQMRTMAHILATTAEQMLGYKTLVSYSGHKGIHVYVLCGKTEAGTARELAKMVLEQTDRFELLRGTNFFKHRAKFGDPVQDMPQLSVEIFPKQDTVDDKTEKLGNLMRLPLGWNAKTERSIMHYRPMFIDVRQRMTALVRRNPSELLTVEDQWAGAVTL